MRIAGYVLAGILVLFGILFILASTDPQNADQGGVFFVGIVLVLAGLGLIALIRWKMPAPVTRMEIHQQLELAGDKKMEQLKCNNCGATLDAQSIKVTGVTVLVSCPYCKSAYELREQPRW